MTSSDKTKSQLIDSMRMSKDAAAESPAPQQSKPKAAPASKKVQKKSKTAPAAKGGAPVKARPAAARSRGRAVDAYQGRRRGAEDPYQGRRSGADGPRE
jgi:hypothetical protein